MVDQTDTRHTPSIQLRHIAIIPGFHGQFTVVVCVGVRSGVGQFTVVVCVGVSSGVGQFTVVVSSGVGQLEFVSNRFVFFSVY
jgi:hypothetical protein